MKVEFTYPNNHNSCDNLWVLDAENGAAVGIWPPLGLISEGQLYDTLTPSQLRAWESGSRWVFGVSKAKLRAMGVNV